MYGRDGIGISSIGFTSSVDVNKDGFPDLVGPRTIFLNIGNNKFIASPQSGDMTMKDLNGDKIPDYIFYDEDTKIVSTLIYKGNGEFKEQTLIENLCISNMYCYDFDKDGDVDILLAFDYLDATSYAFLVFCENDGEGNFTMYENAYPTKWAFGNCADIDNDGYMELIAGKMVIDEYDPKLSESVDGLFIFKITNNQIIREPAECILPGLFYYRKAEAYGEGMIPREYIWASLSETVLPGDINNDGKCELLVQNADKTTYGIHPIDNVLQSNEAPQQLPMAQYVFDNKTGKLKVYWQQGTDKESSSVDLTYELRIGSKPGQGDIWFASANADGSRRDFNDGNMGSNLDVLLDVNSWKYGNYYIAVQVIDPMGKGSAWSEEAVYKHNNPKAAFTVSTNKLSPADTLIVSVARNDEYCTYEWNLADGRIIEGDENSELFKLQFDSPGEKELMLTVTDKESGISDVQREIVKASVLSLKATEWTVNPKVVWDIDGDGITDAICLNGFHVNNGKGEFTKLGTIFNSKLSFVKYWYLNYSIFIDYDMDGDTDIQTTTNKGDLLLNNGNNSFVAQTVGVNVNRNGIEDALIDLNNDGYPELCPLGNNDTNNSHRILKNRGDNRTFEKSSDLTAHFIVDFNRDGLPDLLHDRKIVSMQGYENHLYLNKGNFEFEDKTFGERDVRLVVLFMEDMNNDGYVDLITLKNPRVITIYLGSEDYTYKNYKDYVLPDNYTDIFSLVAVQDFDNNGYLDINIDFHSYVGMLYFSPNLSAEFEIDKEDDISFGYHYSTFTGDYTYSHAFIDLNGDSTPDTETGINRSFVKNTSPSTPMNIRSTQTERGILLQWDDAKDAETPAIQMRYNISVKKKGVTGEGAFIISPMNGLKDAAAVISNYYYPKANRKEIPLERFEVGQEYEVQVQSIDLWNAHSPMSQVYTFTVERQVAVLAPEETCLDATTTVSYCGTEDISQGITWNWDGGTVMSGTGSGPYEVIWTTPGVKTVTVSVAGFTSTKAIMVNKGADLAYQLPSVGLAECEVNFLLPESFKDASQKTEIHKSDNRIRIERRTGSLEAKAFFPEEGKYWIEVSTIDDICGEASNRKYIQIKGTIPTPVIKLVGIDLETGKNKIIWDMPNMPEYVTNVNVYRESGKYNNFELVGSVLPSEGMYIDYTSNPRVTSSRYRIALDTEYNAESNPSRIHSSTHLMLNKGMGNAVNLVWNQYEGGIVESYRILRGTTKENLSVLAEVSGANNAYSDLSAGEGIYYYALEYDNTYSDEWKPMGVSSRKSPTSANASGRSNVVCTDEALTVTLATKLNILALENEMILTPEQTAIHFYTEIFPVMADYKKVNWQLAQGEELATINQNGLLTCNGMENGTIVVRATTIDGSAISKEITVQKKGFTVWASSIELSSVEGNFILTPQQSVLHLQAIVSPASASQSVEWSIVDGTSLATISQSGVLTATGHDNGTITVRAATLDGSGILKEITILKSNFLPSGVATNLDETIRCWYTNNKVYVEGLPQANTDLTLTDMNGRILLRQLNNEKAVSLNVETYAQGVYLLKIDTQKSSIIFRFMK